MDYETRTLAIMVVPAGEPIYSEMATTVTIVDELAGEFVDVLQSTGEGLMRTRISPDEWPTLRKAIDRMIAECRGVEK